jgi:hypothetical protein
MTLTIHDTVILRDLGRQIAEIAALPVQQETITLWKSLNDLQPQRPMVLIDEVCWNEMNINDELTLRTQDAFCQDIERDLRRRLYTWKHMRADMVMEALVTIPKAIYGNEFGMPVAELLTVTDPANEIVSHHYHDQLKNEDDLQNFRLPDAQLDAVETSRREALAHEIFDGILEVEMKGLELAFDAWDWIVRWHQPENVLLDLVDRPKFMHKVISVVTEAALVLLDQAEARGLLAQRMNLVHCTGAYTDQLPAPGYQSHKPRAKDLWTYGMAQIFGSVSPAMHKEFELDYATRWYARFGLVYYGCCEPLDKKLDLVKTIPNLRKISMSPWASAARGAEQIGRDYVFSNKPNPAFVAGSSWDAQVVEKDLRHVLEQCRRYGCPLEFILKDISTTCYQPQRLWEWADIAMRVVKG